MIRKERRLWVVEHRIVAASFFQGGGARLTDRARIDADALEFAEHRVQQNPRYATACVLDLCRTPEGLRMLGTN